MGEHCLGFFGLRGVLSLMCVGVTGGRVPRSSGLQRSVARCAGYVSKVRGEVGWATIEKA